MAIKFYHYKNCDRCRHAQKWLAEHSIDVEPIPIRDQPPTPDELRQMADCYDSLKPLVNTTGVAYRSQNLKSQWGVKSDDDWISLLASDGHLVKRPFLIGDTASGAPIRKVGFKAENWQDILPLVD